MRKILLCLIGMIMIATLPVPSKAQIKTSIQNQELKKIVEYDSTDISIICPEKYINQEVIYYQKTALLYTKDYGSLGGQKEYKAPLFTCFIITNIKGQQVELKRVDNNDICYYTHFGDGVKPVMAIGYYERYVNQMKGSLWCINDYDGIFQIVDIWLRSGGITQTLQKQGDTLKIELNTMYRQKPFKQYLDYLNKFKGKKWVLDSDMTCGEVDTLVVRKGIPYIIFKSDNGKSFEYYIDYSIQDFTDNFNVLGLPHYTQEEQERYIRKYGKINWINILNRSVVKGMTKEMVLLSLGIPTDNVNITDPIGNYDTWHWEHLGIEVMFVNGKVHTITEY